MKLGNAKWLLTETHFTLKYRLENTTLQEITSEKVQQQCDGI